jgi:gliding motility-associated-like protein
VFTLSANGVSCVATQTVSCTTSCPTATLITTSGIGTDNQTICAGNAIIPIQYTFGNGATSATVTGLPTGVTSSISGNVITISGNPSSAFSYTISTVGGCGTATLNGNVTISTNSSLNLTSASGTDNQTICAGNVIIPIQYTFGNGATSATVTGLPTGVTSSISGNVITISGNPSSTFSYTISTVGGCGTATLNGNVTISTNSSLNLTSASGTDNQTICAGNAIIPIQYTFGNGATSATVTGLPTGVTSSISGNVITISGNPSSTFSYTISTVGGCGTATLNGNVTISTNSSLNLTSAAGTDNQTICAGNAIIPIQYTFGNGATSATVTGLPTGVTSSISGNVITISGNSSSTFSYTISTVGGCGTATLNGNVTISTNSSLNLTSAAGTDNQTICAGNAIIPIQYTFGNGATSATVTGLPTGVTSSISGNVITINGNSSSTFSYTISTVGGCGTATLNGTISTTIGITPIFIQEPPLCSGNIANIPTTSTNGIIGIWQIISSTLNSVIYEFTPNPGQCATTTTMTIIVYPRPEVTITSASTSYCDGSVTNITLSSTIPGTTYTWNALSSNLDTTLVFSGSGSTISQTLDLVNNLNVGFVTYSVTPFANGCSGTPQQITIYANPIPEMTASPTLSEICSGDTAHIDFTSNISGVSYSWTFSATGVTGASNGSGTSIDQVLTSSDATTGGFVIYTITPELNGCLGTSVTVQVDVKPRPEFFGTIPTTILCSGETTNIGLSASITGTNFEWTVVSSNITGASDGSGIAIVQTLEAPSVTGTAVYTVVPVLNGCYGSPITVTVTVNPLPKPVLEDGTLCIIQATGEVYQTYTLNTGLSATGYSFDWYFNGGLIAGANAPTYTADEVGLYSVIVTNTTTTCESEEVFATVDFVNPATSFSTVVTEAFTNNATITVSVPDGTGTLLYQLDEGAYQESNVFTGVSAGEHTVTVIDTEGCTFMTQTVLVIDYPKYFTPNGDGHNDTWNIIGMNQADAKLYIFDRYGKLIKQISPSSGSDGWDGTYNGQQLPSTDYWFSLDYTENGAAKQFKAHFSMKR